MAVMCGMFMGAPEKVVLSKEQTQKALETRIDGNFKLLDTLKQRAEEEVSKNWFSRNNAIVASAFDEFQTILNKQISYANAYKKLTGDKKFSIIAREHFDWSIKFLDSYRDIIKAAVFKEAFQDELTSRVDAIVAAVGEAAGALSFGFTKYLKYAAIGGLLLLGVIGYQYAMIPKKMLGIK